MESTSSSVGGRNGRCAARKRSASAAVALRTKKTGSEFAQPEGLVEAPQAISAKFDRDVPIPDGAQLAIDCLGGRRVQGAGDLVAPELQPRDGVVMAHAADPEAEVAQDRFP